MKTKIEFQKYSLNDFFMSFLNKKVPNFNPKPREINIAGSSNIPWGNNIHNTLNPPLATLNERTNPRTYPLTTANNTGRIPKKLLKSNQKNCFEYC